MKLNECKTVVDDALDMCECLEVDRLKKLARYLNGFLFIWTLGGICEYLLVGLEFLEIL